MVSLWEKQFSSLKKYLICTYPWVSNQPFKIRIALDLNYRRSCDGLFNVQSNPYLSAMPEQVNTKITGVEISEFEYDLYSDSSNILLHVIITPNLCNVMLG